MPNSIALFEKYIPLLDEVYAAEAKTVVLDGDTTLVKAGSNTHTIQIPKISMDGERRFIEFGTEDYRKIIEETAGLLFAKLGSEFIRTKVVREMDAVRFAQYAGTAGISTVAAAVLDTADKWIAALTAAKTTMDDDEVTAEGRYLFITPTGLNLIDGMDTYKSRKLIESFAQIIEVPQARFCTGIELFDGKSDDELAGGFVRKGNDINFLIVEKSAIMQYTKHAVNKVISPKANQTSDGYLFFYRAYGLNDVYENKVAGIYLHKSTVVQGGSN